MRYDETRAAVPRPAFLGLFFADGNFFTVTDRREAIGRDTERCQIIHRGLRALGTERHVVISGAALIAVAFDLHTGYWIAFEPVRVCFQSSAGAFREIGTVEVKANIFKRTACYAFA